jgi:hypothetical protein
LLRRAGLLPSLVAPNTLSLSNPSSSSSSSLSHVVSELVPASSVAIRPSPAPSLDPPKDKRPKKRARVVCDQCSSEIADGNISRHKASVHVDSNEHKFKCLDCNWTFPRSDSLEEHRAARHDYLKFNPVAIPFEDSSSSSMRLFMTRISLNGPGYLCHVSVSLDERKVSFDHPHTLRSLLSLLCSFSHRDFATT